MRDLCGAMLRCPRPLRPHHGIQLPSWTQSLLLALIISNPFQTALNIHKSAMEA
jgi:hypothetical protein